MSYFSYEELEVSSVTLPKLWRPDSSVPPLDVAPIPNRSVHFQDPITNTVQFEKDSAPMDLSFHPSFQVPCDTIFPSSKNKQVTLIR